LPGGGGGGGGGSDGGGVFCFGGDLYVNSLVWARVWLSPEEDFFVCLFFLNTVFKVFFKLIFYNLYKYLILLYYIFF
jgi:hypothetical protein